MKRWWVIGGCVVVAATIGLYFAFDEKKAKVEPVRQESATPQAAIPAKPQPVVLPNVVDVIDLDPLLDPPPIPRVETAPPGVVVIAMDDDPAVPVTSISAPATIPPAIEVDEEEEEQQGEVIEATDIDQVNDYSQSTIWWAMSALGSYGPHVLQDRGNSIDENDAVTVTAPPRTPLLLDRDALEFAAQYDARYRSRRSRLDFGDGIDIHFGLPSGAELVQGHPLSPLLDLTDLHLMRRLADEQDRDVRTNTNVSKSRSLSVWIPPSQSLRSFGPIDGLRRVLALASVIYQVPNSRLDWYTAWHGARLLPEAAGNVMTPAEARDYLLNPPKASAGFVVPIYSGQGVGIGYFF